MSMDVNHRLEEIRAIMSRLKLPFLPLGNPYLYAGNFNTPHRMIEFNLYWEHKAIEGYMYHRDKALLLGDIKTAELFSHIMGEEESHFSELLERYGELTRGKG